MNPIREALLRFLIGRAVVACNMITDGTYIEVSRDYLIENVELLGDDPDPGCGYGCGWTRFFVPEAGCPVHDVAEEV